MSQFVDLKLRGNHRRTAWCQENSVGTDLYRDGMARLDAGDVAEGRRLLEEALRKSPGDVTVMHGLSRALDLAGERARSVELLEHANARAPAEPGPAHDLAMALLEREEDARAVQVLTPVLQAHPDDTRGHLFMAMALAKTDAAQARVHTAKALMDPNPDVKLQAQALDGVLAEHLAAS
ncbi:tetratricopeptide repeat protein [Corallococcus macrosporus]|nr:tetratricopeptide repeat protein [Corallococcus macrosporus]